MKKQSIKIQLLIAALWLAMLAPVTATAAGGAGALPQSGVNIRDVAAAQRGAGLFVNYCLSCHSAEYMRYNRLAEDLDLGEELVMQNLVLSNAKIGDTMSIAMKPTDAEKWFGKNPPDLSLVGRSRGADWLYAYMLGFYQDENGGWNNSILANAAMPHVLWELQGIQKPVYEFHTTGGVEQRTIGHLELDVPGSLTPEEYESTVRDLVTFMVYLGEPAVLKRKGVGVWVLLFLSVFALLAFILKVEFWRDVH